MPPWRALFLIQQSGLDTEQNVRGMDIGYMTVKFYHKKILIAYCILHVLILHDHLNCFKHMIAFIVHSQSIKV